MGSTKYNLNWAELKNTAVHAVIIAVATTGVAVLSQLQGADFGVYQGVATIAIGTLLSLARKYLQDGTV